MADKIGSPYNSPEFGESRSWRLRSHPVKLVKTEGKLRQPVFFNTEESYMTNQEIQRLKKLKQDRIAFLEKRWQASGNDEEDYRNLQNRMININEQSDSELLRGYAGVFVEDIRNIIVGQLNAVQAPKSTISEVENMDETDLLDSEFVADNEELIADNIRDRLKSEAQDEYDRNDQETVELEEEIEKLRSMPLKEFAEEYGY